MALLPPHLIIDNAEAARLDAAAIAAGTPGYALMQSAAAGIVAVIERHYHPRPTLILCGPGNNGGDGWEVAHRLAARGWAVELASMVPASKLRGDAALAAKGWDGPILSMEDAADRLSISDSRDMLAIDALFGAGLARPLGDALLPVITAWRQAFKGARLAIDVPSGLDGSTGIVVGDDAARCLPADRTITFTTIKPGHHLQPGASLCGEVDVVDIGLPDHVLNDAQPAARLSSPAQWREQLHAIQPGPHCHKYTRGHGLIIGSAEMPGAACLAAEAAARSGAGVVTVLVPEVAKPLYLTLLPHHILVRPHTDLSQLLSDPRSSSLVIGPGLGTGTQEHDLLHTALTTRAALPTVLDADALTLLATHPNLRDALTDSCLLTPHAGEFARLFPAIAARRPDTGDLTACQQAADQLGSAVLLKGASTVIAAPDALPYVNTHAPPTLATAGAGDVLAGTAGGLMAQGLPPQLAGAMAAWLCGDAAHRFGPGLTASDLPPLLPAAIQGALD